MSEPLPLIDGCSCYGCRRYERGRADGLREGADALSAKERQIVALEFQLAQLLDPSVRAKMMEPPPPILISNPNGGAPCRRCDSEGSLPVVGGGRACPDCEGTGWRMGEIP